MSRSAHTSSFYRTRDIAARRTCHNTSRYSSFLICFPFRLRSVHHSSSKRVLSILEVFPKNGSKKKSHLLPFRQIFRLSSSRSVRMSFNRLVVDLPLSLSFFRARPLPVSSSYSFSPPSARFLSLSRLLPSFLPPRLRFLPLAVRCARSRITTTIAGFSYIFVRPRGVPARREARGGGAAPSPRRSRTVVT